MSRGIPKTLGDEIGVDLVDHPDFALGLDNAAKILFVGMIKGLFTGKKLGDFFHGITTDWVNARSIVNDHDRAVLIAGFGHDFYAAISYTK